MQGSVLISIAVLISAQVSIGLTEETSSDDASSGLDALESPAKRFSMGRAQLGLGMMRLGKREPSTLDGSQYLDELFPYAPYATYARAADSDDGLEMRRADSLENQLDDAERSIYYQYLSGHDMQPVEGGNEFQPGKRSLAMLRLGKRAKIFEEFDTPQKMLSKRQLQMLRLGKRLPVWQDGKDKRSLAMLRLGKRNLRMLRLGKRSVDSLYKDTN